MQRVVWVVAIVVATLLVAGVSWATASDLALQGVIRNVSGGGISAPSPEPTAALLFGLGTGVVAWRLSRKRRS